MKRVVMMLDSCRYDVYVSANTRLWTQHLGKAKKGVSACNHTLPSFVVITNYNRIPRPDNCNINPYFKKRLNFLHECKKNGTKIFMATDNPHLHPVNEPVKAMLPVFDKFKYFTPDYESGQAIFDWAGNLHLGNNYYLILWLGETHSPYNCGDDKTRNWLDLAKRANSYSAGGNTITQKELNYLKDRQRKAVEYLHKISWPVLKKFVDDKGVTIIITADHGESFGENHRYGHGNDIHPAQFTVPLVIRKGT